MVRNMVVHGQLIKLNKSTYENVNYDGEESDYIYAYAYVPDGIICLLSAAVIYGLSTYRPDDMDVAVAQKRNVSTYNINGKVGNVLSVYTLESYRYQGISTRLMQEIIFFQKKRI